MKKQTKLILNSSFLILNFLFTSCYTWFEDKKNMDTTTGQTNLHDFMYEEPAITELTSPTQVLASQGLYPGSVKVNWSQVDNASSYRIERAVIRPDSNGMYRLPEESDFEVIEKYSFKTSFDDKILSNPLANNDEYKYKYYYRISAENINKGYESSEYTDVTAELTKGLGWLLPAPQSLDAWKGKSESEIRLTWEAVDKALNYNIYRGTNPNGTGMEKIETILATKPAAGSGNTVSFTNRISEMEQGTEFYYKVSARLPNGSESAFTSLALGYSLRPGAPTFPSNIKVTDGLGEKTDQLTISWDKVDYNSGGKSGVLTYALYRTSSIDSVYTLVRNNIPKDTTSTVVTDGLKPGIKYYFYLQSIFTEDNGDKNKSSFSETGPNDKETAVGFLLSAPTDVELNDGSADKVILRWTPAIGSELVTTPFTYNIYCDDNQYGDFTTIVKENIPLSELNLDSDGYYNYETDKKNFFRIRTCNSNMVVSDFSVIVAPTPAAPTNVKATKTSGADGLLNYAPNTNEVYPVKITWSKPAAETPAGYHVYRTTSPSASYRKLTENPITETSYIDENETARAGTIYYYKVVSVNVLGQGKKGNDPANGTDAQGYGAVTREQWFREYNKTIMKSQSKLTLMHKSNDMDKLGSETINGDFSGTLSYKAAIAGLGAEITMHYENYCDFQVNGNNYFVLTGNTDTTSNMSANGNMHEKVNCKGMYPGYAIYNNLQIKGGAAGGGYYLVETYDLSGAKLLGEDKVNWLVGEEH